jgi:predicted RNase H-like HicB family nuclease
VTTGQGRIKLIIERTEDGYVAYPLGLKGVVVAQGDTYEQALAEVRSAVRFHIETFGSQVLEEASEAQEVFIAETEVPVG